MRRSGRCDGRAPFARDDAVPPFFGPLRGRTQRRSVFTDWMADVKVAQPRIDWWRLGERAEVAKLGHLLSFRDGIRHPIAAGGGSERPPTRVAEAVPVSCDRA